MSHTKLLRTALVTCFALCAGACADPMPPAGPGPVGPVEPPPPPPPLDCERTAAAAAEPLVWKRGDVLATDLGTALALPPEALCSELGALACTEVHLVPLGGNDAAQSGLYERPAGPLASTPMATERLVLAACAERVDRDARGPAELFALDLSLAALDPDQSATRAALEQDGGALFRRLLTRDPSAEELAVLVDLARPEAGRATTAREWATAACLAVVTHTEMLFF